MPGEYLENITYNTKSIVVTGQHADSTTTLVPLASSQPAFAVTDAATVTLRKFSIVGGQGSGIYLYNCENVYLSDLRVEGFMNTGIEINSAANTTKYSEFEKIVPQI